MAIIKNICIIDIADFVFVFWFSKIWFDEELSSHPPSNCSRFLKNIHLNLGKGGAGWAAALTNRNCGREVVGAHVAEGMCLLTAC